MTIWRFILTDEVLDLGAESEVDALVALYTARPFAGLVSGPIPRSAADRLTLVGSLTATETGRHA